MYVSLLHTNGFLTKALTKSLILVIFEDGSNMKSESFSLNGNYYSRTETNTNSIYTRINISRKERDYDSFNS